MIKQNHRIVEYKDYFTIERKEIKTYFKTFLGFKYNFKTIVHWVQIKRPWQKPFDLISNPQNYQFKTKEECLQWIADKEKYPIYHELK